MNEERIKPCVLRHKRCFTHNASPMNVVFAVEEFLRDSNDRNIPALVMMLDAKLAFDVVNREHFLRHLYRIGIQDRHWSLISSLHQEDSSVIKWSGQMSLSFRVEQCVGQEDIISTDLY